MSNSRRLEAGRRLASPSPGQEVVISGIAGRFPNSDDVEEFKENLMNKVDLCDDDDRRWVHTHDDIPKVSGKINHVDKLDIGAFGVHRLQADFIDPLIRLSIERAYEAIVDAGINPEDVKGSKVGVFIGSCFSEVERTVCYDNLMPQGYGIAGCTRSMVAQRISYALQLSGPSMISDAACSSGMYAFDQAYTAIREGKCDMALVGGTNLCFNPFLTLQFARLGVLNMNTGCRPFDEGANGYTRSEAIAIMLLQKKQYAKRIYAEVVHCKANVDGYKEMGITYPSGDVQTMLLKDVYEECGILPQTLAYVEAHGTGTKVGDPEELSAIDKFFCSQRKQPLLVGSIKGNIGHTEAASGICSIMKVIYAMETGLIPPNIHYDNPRKDIKGLESGRLKVVTEKTPWPKISQMAAINCFGFGGANCHVLLKRPDDPAPRPDDGQPRLVCYSGRTSEATQNFREFFRANKLDYDSVALFHSLFSKRIVNDSYRGFSLIDSNGEMHSSSKYSPEEPKGLLHLFLNGAKHYHAELLKEMEKFHCFANLIDEFKEALKRNQISDDIYELNTNAVFATVCLHYCVIHTFKKLNVNFSSISSTSLGEFSAAHAAGFLTLDETITAVHAVTVILAKINKMDRDLPTQITQQLSKVLPKKLIKNRTVQTPKSNSFEYGSAEYFVYNILNPSIAKQLQWDNGALVVGLDFQERSIGSFQLVQEGMKIEDILVNLGRLYELGVEADWSQLYEKLDWPVRRGTPNISSLVRWKHDIPLSVPHNMNSKPKDPEKSCLLSILNSDLMFYKGHVIDGRNLFPATGYLYLVWDFFAVLKRVLLHNMKVCFENVRFHRATTFGKDGSVNLYFTIHTSGDFEVSESNTTVVTGRIYEVEDTNIEYEGKPSDPNKPTLTHQDIYKELKLRGYNYKGPFKAVQEMCGNNGLIEWTGNWITYLDNMLQLFIIQNDTRSLYVPTGLDRLVIDTKGHMKQAEALGENNLIPVELALDGNIARSKYIEIRGMKANAIMRKKLTYEPVLESYQFVPNITKLTANESFRLNMHLVLENKPTITVKVLEVLDENSSSLQPMSENILDILADLPLMQPDVNIFTTKKIEAITGVQVTQKFPEQKSLVYVGSHLLNSPNTLQEAATKILDDGFLISIDDADHSAPEGFTVLTTHQLPTGEFVHLLRPARRYQEPICIKISEDFDSWLPALQAHLKSSKHILLYSENDPTSGVMGLVNCLRHEPGGEKVSCVFIQDGRKGFDRKDAFVRKQLEKGLAINVLRGETWGTYRHLLLAQCPKLDYRQCEHYFANVLTRGDLSTWSLIQGPFNKEQIVAQPDLIEVYYSAINFRDVMTASGKVPIDAVTKNRLEQDRIHGFEYSGRRQNGERVMGIVIGGAIASWIKCDKFMIWPVPDKWTLEDAATVPVVYLTVIVAMKTRGNVKRGDSVLIHSGTGGVGQAAINCAHHWGCEIFVTVGTKEKKEFLLKNYPFIKESHIGNSRDNSFEQMIFRETGGRGVDYVLNSLAEEKLAASVRCLAPGGSFLEIGKFDIANNSSLAVDLAAKGCTFHGIMLDRMFVSAGRVLSRLNEILMDGLEAGFIKPLIRTVFERNQLEQSFRYMTSGKHMGKVILKMKNDISTLGNNGESHIVIPRFYCSPDASYIILGGLGGFGLELADWLVLRGAKTLILSSRSGVQTGYQKYRINCWQSYGVKIVIALEDIATYEGCQTLLRNAEAIAPVHGIFNLAVVLKDAIFENQSVENFEISMSPKATATKHFDKLTRQSKTLKHFVVFSSVSCGRGNAGQTNYGMSNSVMERICELRRNDGLPGLAIQWGAVGDVGLVADMQKEQSEIAIGGTLQQRISNCLEVMDNLLHQDVAVVSSIIVAEKSGLGCSDNLVDAVMDIMGLRNLNSISLHSTLAELGMDSMMAVEIKQTLERDFDIFFSAQDMRNLTFAKLIELNDSKGTGVEVNKENLYDSVKVLINTVYDMERYLESYIEYKSDLVCEDPVVVFPGIEAAYVGMSAVNTNLNKPSICVQYTSKPDINGIDALADKIMNCLSDRLSKSNTFNFVAHSYGGLVALKIASRLEKMGKTGKIVLIDSSPELINRIFNMLNTSTESDLETTLLITMLSQYTPMETLKTLAEPLMTASSLKERLELATKTFEENIGVPKEMVINIATTILNLVKSMGKYKQFDGKLRSEVLLCKPSLAMFKDIAQDYHLDAICEKPVQILNFDGDHRTILENAKLCEELNRFFT